MQPHGSGTRATVEAEGEWALARVADVIFGIGDVENAGFGRAIFELQEDGAGRRGVFDLLPANFQRMLRLNNFLFGYGRLLFFFRLFCGFFRRWRWLLLRETQIYAQEKQRDGT